MRRWPSSRAGLTFKLRALEDLEHVNPPPTYEPIGEPAAVVEAVKVDQARLGERSEELEAGLHDLWMLKIESDFQAHRRDAA